MNDEARVDVGNGVIGGGRDHSPVLDIYPLSCYYFGSKDVVSFREETLADRVLRMKSK